MHRGFPPSRSADVLHHWTSCGGVRRLSAGWSSIPLARLRIPTLQVLATTSAELPRGWLLGPLSEAELSQRLGIWLPARRFGIRQGTSVRAIDDCSLVGHNATTSIGEMVDMGGVEVVVKLCVKGDHKARNEHACDGSTGRYPCAQVRSKDAYTKKIRPTECKVGCERLWCSAMVEYHSRHHPTLRRRALPLMVVARACSQVHKHGQPIAPEAV